MILLSLQATGQNESQGWYTKTTLLLELNVKVQGYSWLFSFVVRAILHINDNNIVFTNSETWSEVRQDKKHLSGNQTKTQFQIYYPDFCTVYRSSFLNLDLAHLP